MAFAIANAVSKKSCLSHAYMLFLQVNAGILHLCFLFRKDVCRRGWGTYFPCFEGDGGLAFPACMRKHYVDNVTGLTCADVTYMA